MISGFVNASLEPIIALTISDGQVETREIEAVIDTGYNGFLTLPLETVYELKLSHLGKERVQLGDGSLEVFDLYLASVVWDGQPQAIAVDAAETEPLVGTALLAGYDFSARFVSGGDVTIAPI
jgi:clan AA aspartic protease